MRFSFVSERCAFNCANQFILFMDALHSLWQPLKHPFSIHIFCAFHSYECATQWRWISTQLNIFVERPIMNPPPKYDIYINFFSLPNFVDDTNIVNYLPVLLVIHRFFYESIFKTSCIYNRDGNNIFIIYHYERFVDFNRIPLPNAM